MNSLVVKLVFAVGLWIIILGVKLLVERRRKKVDTEIDEEGDDIDWL